MKVLPTTKEKTKLGTSLAVQKTSPSNAGAAGSIPGWGAKIPHASWPKNQNIQQKQYCVTNSIKIVKMVHIQKKIFKKKEHLKYLHEVK